MPVTMAGRPELVKPNAVQWALALACALLWAVKFWLIPRLNINWDEFYFLSQVHAASRAELGQGFQTSYTHLFTWLPHVGGDEITQVRTARIVMVALLGLSAVLIQRLARRWFPPAAAWTAAMAYLAMWPTLKHGASFRADSLLLPLHLAALVVLTQTRLGDRQRGVGAGLLLGVATAISIKTVLLAPVVAVLGVGESREIRRGLQRLGWMAVTALATTAVLLGAHFLSIAGQPATVSTAAQGAWQKTVRNTPWFPQRETLQAILDKDGVFWLVASSGLGWALWRRLWSVAACALALLPVAFYRNSYAYYYVVMWGPACITIAAASAGVQELASRTTRPVVASAAALLLAGLLAVPSLQTFRLLAIPRQIEQRELVTAVHAIFPEPVPYIDHSGMMASFRKANFFMSSWGLRSYVTAGLPFMPRAIAQHQPPLVIANRAVLMPGTLANSFLLAEDREIIQLGYQPYWGPIRIAGASATINGSEQASLKLPFAGNYRLESLRPVRIDGTATKPGSIVTVTADHLTLDVAMEAATDSTPPVTLRLLWRDARPPPPNPPTSLDYYDPL